MTARLALTGSAIPCCVQLDVQLDGRIVDCNAPGLTTNPACSAKPMSLAGIVSSTRTAAYSILPYSMAVAADCALPAAKLGVIAAH